MALRTVASFQKVYQDINIDIQSAPIFVPCMHGPGDASIVDIDNLRWAFETMGVETEDELWEKQRFLDLIIGEIPRLRDDEEGYGPRGKGFIVHVDVPENVEEAWKRLKTLEGTR